MKTPTRLPLLAALLVAGCAGAPQLTPWRADALLTALPASCTTAGAAAPDAATIVPGGLAVVRSEGQEVVLVATRGCVMTIDPASGAAEPLPTRGDSIAPTMVDATSGGLAFASSLSGSVRAIDVNGAVTFNVSGLRMPRGVRLMPGGTALVAEHGAGRVLRLGPGEESRARLVMEGLEGPTGLAVADATTAYVTESAAGRVTRFRLDRFEKKTLADGLARPEGITLMADGRLAVVEAGLRRLVAVNRDTGKTEVLADNLPVGHATAAGEPDTHAVADVAASPGGTLFVSAAADGTVLRVTPRPQPPK